MRTIIDRLIVILSIVFVLIITFYYIKGALIIRDLKTQNTLISDSLGKYEYEKYYMTQLIRINQNIGQNVLSDSIEAYDVEDINRLHPMKLRSILSSVRKTLIIRYTEIGCNACADSTFKLIRKNRNLIDEYDVIILVDFSEYKYYVKWKKISEIDNRILWVKRGSFPFLIENEKVSYLFTIDSGLKPSSFFIPNSNFVPYIRDYLNSL